MGTLCCQSVMLFVCPLADSLRSLSTVYENSIFNAYHECESAHVALDVLIP